MIKNLKIADTIVKLILAALVIVFYFARVISGPLATALMILAILLIMIFAFKVLLMFIIRD